MERIVALVEGHLETHFVQSSYGNAIVQRPFPNGREVSIDAIVESIADRLDTIGGEIGRVLILLDREGRSLSASQMMSQIVDRLSPYVGARKVYIGVTDRHVENWILADVSLMRSQFGEATYCYEGDGTRGKSRLEALVGFDLGYRDKAKLLKACSPAAAATVSPSLRAFLEQIDFDWPWARQ